MSVRSARAVALACVLSSAALAEPPVARVEPVTDDYYGTKVTDPYRWMESGKDPEWMPWLKGQADHARSTLDKLPGRAKLLADISAKTGALPAIGRAARAGDVLLWQERPLGAQDFRLMIKRGAAAPVVLLDPAGQGGEGAQVIDGWELSYDGRHVAVLLSKRGSERSGVHVVETATGQMREGRIGDVVAVRWLPDSSGFTYLNWVGEHGTPSYTVNNLAKLHLLAQPAGAADAIVPTRQIADLAITPGQRGFILPAHGSETVLLGISDGRSEYRVLRADLSAVRAGKPRWTPIAGFEDVIVQSDLSGDRFYAVSRKGSSSGRILRMSASKPDLARATQIVIPGNPVIEELTASRSGVWIETLEGGVSGLWFAPDGGKPRRMALPFAGTVGWIAAKPGTDDVMFSAAGWLDAPKVLQASASGAVSDTGLAKPLPYDVSGYEAVRGEARAGDGVMIPYTMLRRRTPTRALNPAPLLLEAYGSYGYPMTPYFDAPNLPFYDRGGIYVLAGVRGGGEFGRDWHYAGKAETKATTWRDAIAVAEHLIKTGVTTAAKLTIQGTSAGGVMVGGAVNERPDLFAGAIADVGFMNPVRYVSEQNFGDIEEWGGPIADPKSFKTMFDLDPYQHIKPGTRYPATLVISGINDPRAATFHSAKYAARLGAATTSGEPVLLRIDFDAGHGQGSSRKQRDEYAADLLSFVLWQGGAEDFQPAR